jgi:hypothetical protein
MENLIIRIETIRVALIQRFSKCYTDTKPIWLYYFLKEIKNKKNQLIYELHILSFHIFIKSSIA